MISGIVTAILLVAFIGIAVWAWSARNRERWQRAAESPLHDDTTSGCGCGKAHKERGS
jgi:cytochrome c oxidase cbb3-type subunit IV